MSKVSQRQASRQQHRVHPIMQDNHDDNSDIARQELNEKLITINIVAISTFYPLITIIFLERCSNDILSLLIPIPELVYKSIPIRYL